MKHVAFYPSGITISILAILAGIIIWVFPNILEKLLAVFLVVTGVIGIAGAVSKK